MSNEFTNASDNNSVSIVRGSGTTEAATATGIYTVECIDAAGNLKWSDTFSNLVTTVGKNHLLDVGFGATSPGTWYVGLVDNASFTAYAAGDTMASHAGWLESTAYSNATRPAPTFNSASAGSKATTATAFTINATATIRGCFLVNNSTKSGTTGVLYSAGDFSSSKTVDNGDTLNVTYTASL